MFFVCKQQVRRSACAFVLLVAAGEQAGLNLIELQTPKTGFLASLPILYSAVQKYSSSYLTTVVPEKSHCS